MFLKDRICFGHVEKILAVRAARPRHFEEFRLVKVHCVAKLSEIRGFGSGDSWRVTWKRWKIWKNGRQNTKKYDEN